MSEPEKNGGKDELPHSVFRVGDRIEMLADAKNREVDEMSEWRKLFERFVDWLTTTKE